VPSLKAIRRRVASVASTQKTTRAMKLVSSAKLRRARTLMEQATPYVRAATEMAASLPKPLFELFAVRAEARPQALVVVISSDRGLCGAYNVNLMRAVEEKEKELKSRGLEPVFFAVGRRALDHLKRTRATIVEQRIFVAPRLASPALAHELAAFVLKQYEAGEIKEAGIAYNMFRSTFSQQPVYRVLLPIEPPAPAKEEQDKDGSAEPYYLFEPAPAELAPVVVRFYLEAEIFTALLDAETGEHAARMMAMDAATNNAGEMIERLTLEMNRVRQGTITRELMDIVGGAEALQESQSR
jgi:F-type H+-transporting ATPase subunit gamma